MQVFNGTPSQVRMVYDGQGYVFPPLEVQTVPDEAGAFFCERYGYTGLLEVRFGDDPHRAKLTSMKRRRDWLRRAVEYHERANSVQEQKKFSPLPDSQVTVLAKRELPILDRAITELEARLGLAADPELAKMIDTVDEDIAQTDAEVRGKERRLQMLTMDELRNLANERGMQFDPDWKRSELIRELNRHIRAESAA